MSGNPFRDFQRIDSILKDALQHPPEDRAAFVEAQCGSDPELLARIRRLLELADDGPGPLQPGGALQAGPELLEEHDAQAAATGDRFGAWRIVREIGRGGMAVVYSAERADGAYRQQAAIKLLHQYRGSGAHAQRFERERDLLAQLDHPNIARLLDGGTTEDGRPFLVMEYVEGEPIDRYCDARGLSIQARLKLFLAVCDAVQFAHRQLIVHRDIKPSNILVTAEGVPKLLDFGIAKLLEPDPELGDPTVTALADRVLTPQYSSPEQILGETVSTATDVYALGLLLYELLSGHRARHIDSTRPSDIERAICDSPPAAPSLVAATDVPARQDWPTIAAGDIAAARGMSSARLRRSLRGDLDNIVLMALRREPERRYASTEQMAEDVRRHLDALPVRARPDSLAYRADRFLRRHAVGMAIAIGVVVLITGLVGFYTDRLAGERNTAEQAAARAQVEAAKAEQVARFLTSLFEAARPEEARGEEITARELLTRGVERAEELDDQPEVQARLYAVIGKTYHRLDDLDRALELYERALTIREQHFGPVHEQVAASLNDLGVIHRNRGDFEDAEKLLTRAVEMRRELLNDRHADLAISVDELGRVLRDLGDYDAAETLFREGLAIRRQVHGDVHTETLSSLNSVAQILQDQGKLADAEELFRELVDGYRELLGAGHPWVATAQNNLANLLIDLERWSEAEQLLEEALTIRQNIHDPDHGSIALTMYHLGDVYREQGRIDEARTTMDEAIRIAKAAWGDVHPWLTGFTLNRGRIELAAGNLADARSLLVDSLAMHREVFPEDDWRTAEAAGWLGQALVEIGEYEDAEPLLLDSHAIIAEQRGPDHALAREIRDRIVAYYQRRGMESEASQFQATVVESAAPE